MESQVYNAVIEHYKELNAVQRHYDNQLWLVPGLAYAIISVLYGVAYSNTLANRTIKLAVLAMSVVVFFGLLLKVINELAYQSKNSTFMKACRIYLGIDSALEKYVADASQERSKWSIKYEKVNATKYVVFIMCVTQLFILINFIYELCQAI